MRYVIIDTDCSSDVDDFGALQMALLYHKLGLVQILAINVCTSNTYSPGIITALCNAMGVAGIPIGTWKGSAFDPNAGSATAWTSYIYSNYGGSGTAGTPAFAAAYPDARAVFAAALASAPGLVDVLAIGPHTNLHTYLTDNPTLSGRVRALWCMGGDYLTGAEFNFGSAGSDADYVLANWPAPIVFVGYTAGTLPTVGGTLAGAMPAGDILRVAYAQYGASAGRSCWDPLATYAYLTQGAGMSMTRGNNVSTAGANTFSPTPAGRHYYFTKADSDATLQARINYLMEQRAPSALVWPRAMAVVI